MTLFQALTNLNNAAYTAAKAARAANQWVLAEFIRQLALRTDAIKDNAPQEATE